jgi:hypothetical protein
MRDRRSAAALLFGILIASVAPAQPHKIKDDQKEPQSQYWIVLLDVSGTANHRETEQSQELGRRGYRLRSEILTMMQTFVASLQERNPNEKDYFDVYVFGGQTRRIDALPVHSVQWSDIKDEKWWEAQIPTDLGSRTDYTKAIGLAADLFDSLHKESKKNLLLISDGELDVGVLNRDAQATLEREELERYRNFLRSDNPTMEKLQRNKVSVFTLAFDEGLHGNNYEQRYKQIGQRLNQYRQNGPSFLDKGLGVVEELSGRVGSNGRMTESEGPYVLRALAEAFGGKGRSVRTDNVLDLMWDTIFPNQPGRRLGFPPGTDEVIISAPVSVPIPVKIWKDHQKVNVILKYDPARTSYNLEPPDAELDRVQVHATSQYATWLIQSKNLAELNLTAGEEAYNHFRYRSFNNVRFVWQDGKPQEKDLVGRPVDLVVELRREPGNSRPSLEEWRNILSSLPITATARITPPDFDPQEIRLLPEVLRTSPDGLLRLTGRFSGVRSPGTYEAQASIEVGNGPEAWSLSSRNVYFQAFGDSPLSVPGRFSLVARIQQEGETGAHVKIEPPQLDNSNPAVEAAAQPPARLAFEWWADPEKGCEGVDQLAVGVTAPERPDLNLAFGSSRNLVAGKTVQEDGHRVCYRSPPELLPEIGLGRPLTVEASDGLVRWQRALLVTAPEPPGKRILHGLLYGFLVLLLAASLAFALIPGLRRWLLARLATWRADFPLAVDIAGGASLAWQPTDKVKRFLVSSDSKGNVEAEVTRRGLQKGAQGFEVRPAADEYRVRLLAGSGWTFRKSPSSTSSSSSRLPSASRLLGPEGESLTFLELARGTRMEIEHQGTRITIRHKDR